MTKKKIYAVRTGRQPGIYHSWFGARGAEKQVRGFPGARYRGFGTLSEARAFLEGHEAPPRRSRKKASGQAPPREIEADIVIYTDGGALTNPGPGGYGAVLLKGDQREELSSGYRRTTNNRMELMACIAALAQVTRQGWEGSVALFSDSRYVVNGITRGWAAGWRRRGWKKASGEAALNPDLWKALLDLVEKTGTRFYWVRGHAGTEENERCDHLAGEAARRPGQPPDLEYEKTTRA